LIKFFKSLTKYINFPVISTVLLTCISVVVITTVVFVDDVGSDTPAFYESSGDNYSNSDTDTENSAGDTTHDVTVDHSGDETTDFIGETTEFVEETTSTTIEYTTGIT